MTRGANSNPTKPGVFTPADLISVSLMRRSEGKAGPGVG